MTDPTPPAPSGPHYYVNGIWRSGEWLVDRLAEVERERDKLGNSLQAVAIARITAEGYRDECERQYQEVVERLGVAEARVARLEAALRDIRDHWYDPAGRAAAALGDEP